MTKCYKKMKIVFFTVIQIMIFAILLNSFIKKHIFKPILGRNFEFAKRLVDYF